MEISRLHCVSLDPRAMTELAKQMEKHIIIKVLIENCDCDWQLKDFLEVIKPHSKTLFKTHFNNFVQGFFSFKSKDCCVKCFTVFFFKGVMPMHKRHTVIYITFLIRKSIATAKAFPFFNGMIAHYTPLLLTIRPLHGI